ncbi:MAG: phosphoribosylanthranilate isomerase [Nitrospirales bacterium]|nr:phosphoribosylanthranilate isomerase [Nitrospirales bacterium]
MRIKICGITNLEDALAAVEYGADALGFIFFGKSPRFILPEEAKGIVSHLPPLITTVGVFVNEEPARMREIMERTGLDILQLHGDEPPGVCAVWPRVIRSVRVKELTDLKPLEICRAAAFLLDTYSPGQFGGTGQIFNWDIAVEAKRYGRIILSGGLNSGNVGKAIQRVRPYAVDVSSGVEQEKGRKDLKKMRAFIERARAAALSPAGIQ